MSWYSIRKHGSMRLSPNYIVREFSCPDGSDLVFIDRNLVDLLDDLSSTLNTRIVILSAFRTPTYQRRLGGLLPNAHIEGRAADIFAEGFASAELCDAALSLLSQRGSQGRAVSHNDWHCHVEVETGVREFGAETPFA